MSLCCLACYSHRMQEAGSLPACSLHHTAPSSRLPCPHRSRTAPSAPAARHRTRLDTGPTHRSAIGCQMIPMPTHPAIHCHASLLCTRMQKGRSRGQGMQYHAEQYIGMYTFPCKRQRMEQNACTTWRVDSFSKPITTFTSLKARSTDPLHLTPRSSFLHGLLLLSLQICCARSLRPHQMFPHHRLR